MLSIFYERTNVSPAVPAWLWLGPLWMLGAPLFWVSHSAPVPVSVVQPQYDRNSKLQANHTYAAAKTKKV